jgi:hypothetical protein
MHAQVVTGLRYEHDIAVYPTWHDELSPIGHAKPGPSNADLMRTSGRPFTIPCTEGRDILYDKILLKIFIFPCQLPLEVQS